MQFMVKWREVAYMELTVEAESQEAVEQLIEEGELDLSDAVETDSTNIDFYVEPAEEIAS